MTATLWVFIVLLLAVPTFGADKGEADVPDSLTPQEIEDGWLLLFDGETAFGWKIDGEAKVEDGILILGGSKPTQARTTTAFDWDNAWLKVETKWEGDDPPSLQLGSNGRVTLNEQSKGKFLDQAVDSTVTSGGPLPVTVMTCDIPAGSQLHLRSVRCRPTDLKPIFNGKDLSGWKKIAGRQSEFSVTDEGELTIKDGPGDIQTEEQWADFILQLDIKTNGKHLNSGVFFRATPGQFWSGYESQIRNQWEGDDRTQPVDFGTGGIYNQQAARKVVSNDNEWFTKTIIAHENHIAVWVNGYQVSDFTDERSQSDNAREGSKLGKGPVSLQGHDPTTDLNFRRIRIAPLPSSPEK